MRPAPGFIAVFACFNDSIMVYLVMRNGSKDALDCSLTKVIPPYFILLLLVVAYMLFWNISSLTLPKAVDLFAFSLILVELIFC